MEQKVLLPQIEGLQMSLSTVLLCFVAKKKLSFNQARMILFSHEICFVKPFKLLNAKLYSNQDKYMYLIKRTPTIRRNAISAGIYMYNVDSCKLHSVDAQYVSSFSLCD